MSDMQSDTEKVWRLMSEIEIAMIVTHSGNGDNLRSRPMRAYPDAEANTIYFLSDAGSRKDEEVEANANACLAFADTRNHKYVSVTGHARITNDRDKIRQLWTPADKAFFKDENDPTIRVLQVEPASAQYWEGASMALTLVKKMAARITGGESDVGRQKHVAL